jgi:hypothetical protein
MPTARAHCYLNVPLPTGVAAVDDWRPNDPLPYQVVLGEGRGVTDHNVVVHTVAIQFADGRIDDGRIKAPTVTISHAGYNGRGLSSTQARELAARLLEGTVTLWVWVTWEDRWVSTATASYQGHRYPVGRVARGNLTPGLPRNGA